MKKTKQRLREVIKEELRNFIKENLTEDEQVSEVSKPWHSKSTLEKITGILESIRVGHGRWKAISGIEEIGEPDTSEPEGTIWFKLASRDAHLIANLYIGDLLANNGIEVEMSDPTGDRGETHYLLPVKEPETEADPSDVEFSK